MIYQTRLHFADRLLQIPGKYGLIAAARPLQTTRLEIDNERHQYQPKNP
jgi:hypothetical protein